MMGYFSPNRWSSTNGKKCHELAINPLYVGRATLIELMQTIVHEMCHCWQECYGKPSRKGYHNKEWANKMLLIGLVPSTTGRVGGAIIGQSMSDYPAPQGKFIQSCKSLLKEREFALPWVDRFAQINKNSSLENTSYTLTQISEYVEHKIAAQLTAPIENLFDTKSFIANENTLKNVKTKYKCPYCNSRVWGKPNLSIICGNCNTQFNEIT